jgi:predicted nucleic acid-binding protein
MFVLDASVAAAWFFPDEAAEYTEAMLERLRGSGAVVPEIWFREIANVLLAAERRQRLTEAQTARLLQFLQSLPISVTEREPNGAMEAVLALGREQNLSAYDASYLELAMREGLPLATQDRRMQAAAQRVGVELAR